MRDRVLRRHKRFHAGDARMVLDSSAVSAARDSLPWWVGTGRLAFVPFAGLVSFAFSWLGTGIALGALKGLAADGHWTERARRLFPARTATLAIPWLSGFAVWFALALFLRERSISRLDGQTLALLCGVVAFFAAYGQVLRVERLMGLSHGYVTRLGLGLHPLLWLWPHAAIAFVAWLVMPHEHLLASLGVVAAAVLLTVLALRGGTTRVLALLGLFRPAHARLSGLIARSAARMGMAPPPTWLVRSPAANAFALMHSGDLVFTERTVEGLSDEELVAITSHELGHLSEPRNVRMARLATTLLPFALMAVVVVAQAFGPYELWVGPVALFLFFVGLARMGRIAHAMEVRADALAVQHEETQGVYARALERVYELNLMPVVHARAVHPNAYDRCASAGVTPAYPRPALPPRGRLLASILVAGVGVAVATLAVFFALLPVRESAPMHSLAITGLTDDLATLASARWARGDQQAALPLYRAVSELNASSASWAAATARLAALTGDCADGARWLAEARRRPQDSEAKQYIDAGQTDVSACRTSQLYALGLSRWQAGDLKGAAPYYEAGSKLDASSVYFPAYLARLYAELGDCNNGGAWLAEAHQRPANSNAQETLLHAKNAVAACQPREARKLGEQGLALWIDGDAEAALTKYREASSLEKTSVFWPAELARMEAMLGRCDEASEWLDEAVRRPPNPEATDFLSRARDALVLCLRERGAL
jgi:Zn-dependent protease with chaperone function/tetratricopeptide (TPR) repeat protein